MARAEGDAVPVTQRPVRALRTALGRRRDVGATQPLEQPGAGDMVGVGVAARGREALRPVGP
jgi:hypothetical protein